MRREINIKNYYLDDEEGWLKVLLFVLEDKWDDPPDCAICII